MRSKYEKYLVMIRAVANGGTHKLQDILGCTPAEFVAHMRSTLAVHDPAAVLSPRFYKKLITFDLTKDEDRKVAFHYTNIFAVPKESHLPGGYRRRRVPLSVDEARATLSTWV